MKNVLMICNTVLQVIFAVNLRYTVFSEDAVELVISDHSANAENVVKNSKGIAAFTKVSYVKTKELDRSEHAIASSGRWGIIKDELLRKQLLGDFFKTELVYDVILAANPDKFVQMFYNVQILKNPGLKYYMYEDGLSAYCVLGEQLHKQRSAVISGKHKLIDLITRKRYASKNIAGLYLFEPSMCQWKEEFPFLAMPKIDRRNAELISTLNQMFGYQNMTDSYDAKYIFFEESYFVEGTKVNDVQLVDEIASIVGKHNIQVKIHPRNPVNRFKELGYRTNENTVIPWELIMLNESCEDKVLVSIASGSMANPFLLMGMKVKAIVLLQCAEGEFGSSGNIYNDFLYNQVYIKHPEVFSVPADIGELRKVIRDYENR